MNYSSMIYTVDCPGSSLECLVLSGFFWIWHCLPPSSVTFSKMEPVQVLIEFICQNHERNHKPKFSSSIGVSLAVLCQLSMKRMLSLGISSPAEVVSNCDSSYDVSTELWLPSHSNSHSQCRDKRLIYCNRMHNMEIFSTPFLLLAHYRWGWQELHLASSTVRLGYSRWGQQVLMANNCRTRQLFPTICPNFRLS